jgi:hypothetical protein
MLLGSFTYAMVIAAETRDASRISELLSLSASLGGSCVQSASFFACEIRKPASCVTIDCGKNGR